MLKTIEVAGYGPYVCGRVKSKDAADVQKFSDMAVGATFGQTFADVDAIRAAAKSMHPIYAAVGNILGNDKYGDCTCAAALKVQAILDCAAGREWRMPTLDDALWLYSKVSDFDPATGQNDNGAELQTVLSRWQSSGVYKDGHGKIREFASVNGSKKAEVIAALNANGLLYAGLELADGFEKITGSGFTWDMEGQPDPNAGHCIWVYGHNDTGVFVSTWGMEGTMTWDAVAYYFGTNSGELYSIVAA